MTLIRISFYDTFQMHSAYAHVPMYQKFSHETMKEEKEAEEN